MFSITLLLSLLTSVKVAKSTYRMIYSKLHSPVLKEE
jgi:hypothetical protein